MKAAPKRFPAIVAPMDGLSTFRALPLSSGFAASDPFLALNHHGPQDFPPQNQGLPFGPHPHRGFETLTLIFEGESLHEDNTGAKSLIRAGGMQWMSAAKGIVHSEGVSEDFKRAGGRMDLIQLWINLPSRLKSQAARYIGLQAEEIPEKLFTHGVKLRLFTGEIEGIQSQVHSGQETRIFSLKMPQGGLWTGNLELGETGFIYVLRGSIQCNGVQGRIHDLLWNEASSEIELRAEEPSLLLLGQAKPIQEPIVAYGPFVMTTRDEILQAIEDFSH